MEFYIRPPGGTVALYNIERCIAQRFEVLKLFNYNESTDDVAFDCLMEGTMLDKVGHHMLRLMCLSCPESREFLIDGETYFFVKRLNTVTEGEILGAVQRLKKHITDGLKFYTKSKEMLEVLSTINNILSQMQSDALLHAFGSSHSEDCSVFTVKLPFKACLQLVRKRLVELSDGFATVPCGGWRQLLLPALFTTQLKTACHSATERGCLHTINCDERLKPIVQKLTRWFQNRSAGLKSNILLADDVKAHAHLFPPCQVHLYQTLRERHRLSHEPRRVLSLFLKDIGMPVEQAVTFWKREYSQKAAVSCSCKHSWQKDMRKLVYSIRHMYGLEGSRIKYKAHSCRAIQDIMLPPVSEGGCPFAHFDRTSLLHCLSQKVSSNPTILEDILSVSKEFPITACHKYLTATHLCTKESSPRFTTPVQYYACALSVSKIKE